MKLINFQDIKQLKIPPPPPMQYYQWAVEVIKMKSRCILPPKVSLKPKESSFINTMPCIIPELDRMGVKVVTRYPGRQPSISAVIQLYCQSTGELLAMMDGTFITSIRTGAVAAHSAILFSRKGFTTVGFIGLGNTARATLEILHHVIDRPLTVNILLYKDQAESFAKRFSSSRLEFKFYDSCERLISNSDCVFSSITYADRDLAADSCYHPGCTIIPIHTRGFGNCDLFFDKVFADDKSHVDGFKYFDRWRNFAETCDVVTGKVDGRINYQERILVYNIGIAVQDIYFAEMLYRQIEKSNCFDFAIPEEKFWV